MLRLGSSGWCTAASCLGPASARLSDEDEEEEESEEDEGDGDGEEDDEDAVSSRMSMSHSETMPSPTAHSPVRIPPSSRKQWGMLQGSDENMRVCVNIQATHFSNTAGSVKYFSWLQAAVVLAEQEAGAGARFPGLTKAVSAGIHITAPNP